MAIPRSTRSNCQIETVAADATHYLAGILDEVRADPRIGVVVDS